MEIVYNNQTLFVNIFDEVDKFLVNKMETRVFRIIDDYDIRNIVVNILSDSKYDKDLLNKFINNYQNKYEGEVKIN